MLNKTNMLYIFKKPTIWLVLIIFTGCDKLDFTQFEMEYTSDYVYEAGLGSALPFTTATPEIQSHSSSKFASNDTRADKVETIYLQSMKLIIQSPEDANFDFLNEISITIDSEGMDEMTIASKSNVLENGSMVLDMDVDGSLNLKNYIISDEFVFKTTTKTDRTINQDIVIEIRSVFLVDAEII